MQKTLQDLISDVETMMYNASGPGVQVYSQAILEQKLQQAFDRLFHAKFWPQFMARETRTLDGVTGKVVTPFTLVKEWGDVNSVFRQGSSRALATMPDNYNVLDIPNTATPRFIQPSNDSTLFTIYPLQSTGQISVVGREAPANIGQFDLGELVPFDYLALEYLAAWEAAVDDGSNGAMAVKFQSLFDSRLKQLEDDAFDNVVMLSPNSNSIPLEWR